MPSKHPYRNREKPATPRRSDERYAYAWDDPCAYCNGKSNQWDHIEPFVGGGAHDPENMTRCCYLCNEAKRVSTLLVFLARRAQLRSA